MIQTHTPTLVGSQAQRYLDNLARRGLLEDGVELGLALTIGRVPIGRSAPHGNDACAPLVPLAARHGATQACAAPSDKDRIEQDMRWGHGSGRRC